MKNNSNLSYSNQRIRQVSDQAYMQANAYRLRGDSDRCVLVDPGSGVKTREILEVLAEEGLGLAEIEAVLLTHYHCDHALSAPWFHDQGIPIIASAHTADILERADSRIWNEHKELIRPCPVDRIIADGETFSLAGVTITAVATPGHTRGCMSFLLDEPDGTTVALVGDVLLTDGQPGWAGDEYSPEQLLESLQTLHDINPKRAYGGHGILEDGIRAWLELGMDLGRQGQWNPPTHWQAQTIPPELKPQLNG